MAVDSIDIKDLAPHNYQHTRWEYRRRILRFLLRTIAFTWLVKLERVEGIENVPPSGPMILFMNHIAFVDPILVLHVVPRNIVPLAKIEVYRYPFIGIFPRLWGVIAVRREEIDRRAIHQAMSVLRAGEILLIAPEGTRRPALARGKEGVAYLASRSGVPVVAVAIEGTPGFPALRGTTRWREHGATIHFSRPFQFRAHLKRPSRDQLRQMTDEAMYVLASMLPEPLRGFYTDLSQATQDTIEWI